MVSRIWGTSLGAAEYLKLKMEIHSPSGVEEKDHRDGAAKSCQAGGQRRVIAARDVKKLIKISGLLAENWHA